MFLFVIERAVSASQAIIRPLNYSLSLVARLSLELVCCVVQSYLRSFMRKLFSLLIGLILSCMVSGHLI